MTVFLDIADDSFTIIFGYIFSLVFDFFLIESLWIGVLKRMKAGEINKIWDGLFLLFRFLLVLAVIIFLFGHATIFAYNPIIMVSKLRLFIVIDGVDGAGVEFINKRVGLYLIKVGIKIKEWLKFDGFLFLLEVREDTFEDIRSIICSHIDSNGYVFDVGEETVTFNKAHVLIEWDQFLIILFSLYIRNW